LRVPRNPKLDIVVLQGNERQGRRPIFAEEKLERQKAVDNIRQTRQIIVQIPLAVVLRASYWLDLRHPSNVLGVHHLAAYQKLYLVYDLGPVNTRDQGTGCILGYKVHVAQQVTLLLEAYGRYTSGCRISLNNLALSASSIMGIPLVI
jgi:hypothetical protein